MRVFWSGIEEYILDREKGGAAVKENTECLKSKVVSQ